ncbi:MAG: CoA transferase [Planctomycetes bacterium]|nr:CoA transferase [Planctomycetota bacterium]
MARQGPLTDLLVLDVTRVLAGPFAGMVLADLGAEVIKVERPGQGDDARAFGPFRNGVSAYFASVNRGKKGITLDLQKPAGRDIFLRLAEKADVVIENFRPGVMARLGLGYEQLRERNPRLIYAACSGFGQTGPYAHRPAYDAVIQAMGGIMSLTGEEGGPPVRVGVSIGDIAAALCTAIGILAALHKRGTGVPPVDHRQDACATGQLVDVAMLDCQLGILENAIARYFTSGQTPGRLGTRHPSITPFQAFGTADGYVVVAIGNDKLWAAFCRAIGRPELLADERFADNHLRTQNHAALEPLIQAALRTRPTADWLAELERLGIPCGPINSIGQLAADPQVAAREMIQEVLDPVAGPMQMAGVPIKLSATPGAIAGPAPALGEHTDEVLVRLLGLSPEALARLHDEDVV